MDVKRVLGPGGRSSSLSFLFRRRWSLAGAFWASLLMMITLSACPRSTKSQPPSPFIRGVGLGLFATDENWNYGSLLDEIKATGATDVLVVVPLYQSDVRSHDMGPQRGKTPTDVTVRRTLLQISQRGMRATFLPIVRLKHRLPTEWRGRIQPQAGVDAWFDAYEKHILRYASLAEEGKAVRFVVGSELLSLERVERRWRSLIAQTRKRFHGKLTYSANWDHFAPIRFWDALDEIGVTAYFELVKHLGPVKDAELDAGWRGPRENLAALKRRMKKPLFITEVGYPSKVTAARYPWDETRKAPLDHALQAQLYDAFCRNFADAEILDGYFFWNWFGFGGPADGDYTPRHKIAAKSLQRCLARESWDAPKKTPLVKE